MNDLHIFKNDEFGMIRTVLIKDKPFFVGKDVAVILGYSNTADALSRHVDDDDKLGSCFTTSGQSRIMTVINESGLYSLILSSKLPSARRFKHWVTAEVLPAIRRTGGYIGNTNNMTDAEIMAKAFMISQNTIAERDKRIGQLEVDKSKLTVEKQIMQPKAEYFDALVDRNLLTSFRDTAKQLGMGPRNFVDQLLYHRYIYRDEKGKLMPYAGKNDGLFQVKECINTKTSWSGVQTLITPKGRETFRLLFDA